MPVDRLRLRAARARARLARFVTLRVAFVLLAVAALLAGVAAVTALQTQHDLREVIRRVEVQARVDEAQRCVISWRTREDIRDAAEKAARTGAGVAPRALGQLVTEMGRSDQQAALDRLDEITKQLTEQGVDAARAEIPDPTCDRDAAQQVIDQEKT